MQAYENVQQQKSKVLAHARSRQTHDEIPDQHLTQSHGGAVAQQRLQERMNRRPAVKRLNALAQTAQHNPQARRSAQLQASARPVSRQGPSVQRRANDTGLPDHLKTGIEALSGHAMDDVEVHYNSGKPAQLNALAYAQGRHIYLGHGQERHLPHEAWHVAQQKQGRVRPTLQANGVAVNDDKTLEKEADVMGARAARASQPVQAKVRQASPARTTAQMIWIDQGGGLFVWHALRDGTRWFYDEGEDLMFFKIERMPTRDVSPEVLDFYTKYQGAKMPYEEWIKLMTRIFDVQPDELPDKDDPVFENPEFLVGEEDPLKVNTARAITAALGAQGIHVFLGGAGAAPLFTTTRPINDLDLRVDGLPRNAFDGESGIELLARINKTLGSALTLTQAFNIVAKTTIRGEVNGVEVSITSEPSTPSTLTRGEMIPGVESLGEFDFLLDKAFAAANRPNSKIDSVATDVFDIIMTRRSLPNGGAGILSGLDALRGGGLATKLIERLEGLLGTSSNKKINGRMRRGRDHLIKDLGLSSEVLAREIQALILELQNQVKISVL